MFTLPTLQFAFHVLLVSYALDMTRQEGKMQIPLIGPAPTLFGRVPNGMLSNLFAPKAAV
jgi:hypothetical protein